MAKKFANLDVIIVDVQNQVQQAFSDAMTWVKGIKTKAVTAFTTLLDFFPSLPDKFVPLQRFFNSFQSMLAGLNLMSDLKAITLPAVDAVSALFGGGMADLMAFVGKVSTVIEQLLPDAFGDFQRALGLVFDCVPEMFSNPLKGVGMLFEAVQAFMSAIRDVGKGVVILVRALNFEVGVPQWLDFEAFDGIPGTIEAAMEACIKYGVGVVHKFARVLQVGILKLAWPTIDFDAPNLNFDVWSPDFGLDLPGFGIDMPYISSPKIDLTDFPHFNIDFDLVITDIFPDISIPDVPNLSFDVGVDLSIDLPSIALLWAKVTQMLDAMPKFNPSLHLGKPDVAGIFTALETFGSGLIGKSLDSVITLYNSFDDMLQQNVFDIFREANLNLYLPAVDLTSIFQEVQQHKEKVEAMVEEVNQKMAGVMTPKFGKRFAKAKRGCTTQCECGLFPTTAGGKYETGVGLVSFNATMIAPFTGMVVAKTRDTITLDPIGIRWGKKLLTVYNIRPAVLRGVKVMKDSKIGTIFRAADCGFTNSFHISMKNKPARKLFGGPKQGPTTGRGGARTGTTSTTTSTTTTTTTAAAAVGTNATESVSATAVPTDFIDPTPHVYVKAPLRPQWVSECDEYKFVLMGATIRMGTVMGPAEEKPVEPDRQAEGVKPAGTKPTPSARPTRKKRRRRELLDNGLVPVPRLTIYGGTHPDHGEHMGAIFHAACQQHPAMWGCASTSASTALLQGMLSLDVPCDGLPAGQVDVCPFAACEALGRHCQDLHLNGGMYENVLPPGSTWGLTPNLVLRNQQLAPDRGSLAYRSHHGDLQYWHAMAGPEPSTNTQVRASIVAQATRWYNELRHAEVEPLKLFQLGRILHMVQAGFCDAHTMRDAAGRVVLFQTNGCQGHHPRLLLDGPAHNRAVNATAALVGLVANGGTTAQLIAILEEDIFPFAAGRSGAATGVHETVPCCTSVRYARQGAAACEENPPYAPVDHAASQGTLPDHSGHRIRRETMSADLVWSLCMTATTLGAVVCGSSQDRDVPLMLGVRWPHMPCDFSLDDTTPCLCDVAKHAPAQQHWHAMAEFAEVIACEPGPASDVIIGPSTRDGVTGIETPVSAVRIGDSRYFLSPLRLPQQQPLSTDRNHNTAIANRIIEQAKRWWGSALRQLGAREDITPGLARENAPFQVQLQA